ncbi:MAG: molybdate ABC transporter substrate-binding protein [Eubacteriales bacterium]
MSSIMDLDTDKVTLIALGNSDVPVGRYARELLENLGIWSNIKSKISYASNVKEVLSQVELGSVTCGIVYATDAATNDNVVIVETLDSSLLDTPVIYPAAALASTSHSDAANLFLAYLTSELATTTFEDNGFTVIADPLAIENTDIEPCTLTIFAAASLLESVTAISEAFMTEYDGIEIITSFDSSGTLATQIEYGADVDIFISASEEEMNDLTALSLINESTYMQLLENELVLITGGDTN